MKGLHCPLKGTLKRGGFAVILAAVTTERAVLLLGTEAAVHITRLPNDSNF